MAFEPDKWKNGADGKTPVTAAELNRIESAGAAKAATGPKGDAGPKGAKGDAGEVTQAAFDELEARVAALEV